MSEQSFIGIVSSTNSRRLLGGAASIQSSRMATLRMVLDWAEAMMEGDNAACVPDLKVMQVEQAPEIYPEGPTRKLGQPNRAKAPMHIQDVVLRCRDLHTSLLFWQRILNTAFSKAQSSADTMEHIVQIGDTRLVLVQKRPEMDRTAGCSLVVVVDSLERAVQALVLKNWGRSVGVQLVFGPREMHRAPSFNLVREAGLLDPDGNLLTLVEALPEKS